MIQDSIAPSVLDPRPLHSEVDGLALYRNMKLIRALEVEFQSLAKEGLSRGSLHLSEGQEAIPAGACAALRKDDYLTVTYRGHGYALCKGTDVNRMVAEVAGRRTGTCKGKGGKMHITDVEFGILGANGIVAGGIPTAVGAALGAQMDRRDNVAMTVFGDATINQGAAHEALNLAAVWNLPVIFLCENNQYGEMTPFSVTSPTAGVAERMAAYGIEGVLVDGNDPIAVYEVVKRAVEKGRAGGGPTFIEAMTYRTCGHYNGDPGGYRDEAEVEEWRAKGPIVRFERRLLEGGRVTQADLDRATEEANAIVAAAHEFAVNSPAPSVEELTEDLYV